MTNKFINFFRKFRAKFYRLLLQFYFNQIIRNKKFCIISNDCWGGELYKLLKKPFNTPFIGLMLMSPCYIKLLENPRFYLQQPLLFKKKSKYSLTQKIGAGVDFPLGVLGDSDIEIHFMHYGSEAIAKEKWQRRVNRIDWENLFIKYDCGKDYADISDVEKFIEFPYPQKLLFGQENFGKKEVVVIKNYSIDGAKQFRNCFLNFNPVGWLVGKASIKNKLEKFICRNAFKYL